MDNRRPVIGEMGRGRVEQLLCPGLAEFVSQFLCIHGGSVYPIGVWPISSRYPAGTSRSMSSRRALALQIPASGKSVGHGVAGEKSEPADVEVDRGLKVSVVAEAAGPRP